MSKTGQANAPMIYPPVDLLWVEFRSSPHQYLSSRKSSVETFVHDLLQQLYLDEKTTASKLMALGILQEKAEMFFSNPTLLEYTMATLKNLLSHNQFMSQPLLRSQVLCTMATVLCVVDIKGGQEKLLTNYIDLLFTTIESVTSDHTRMVRMTACECLKELEMKYPGLLSRKLTQLLDLCAEENSVICQHYMALASTVLHHAVLKMIDDLNRDVNCEKSFGQPGDLVPYSLPSVDHLKTSTELLINPPENKLMELIDTHELKRGVSLMMDHLNLATPPVMVHIVRMLMRAVHLSGISAMTFKSFLMRYSSSQELMLFHIVFLLKVLFGSELCNASEDELILKRNIIIATHPSLSTHHKLVTFNWLLHYPLKQVLSGNRTPIQYSLPYIIDYNDLATLFPTGFDHVDIVAAKLDALSQCFTPGTTNDSSSATLMSCLMGLQKAVYHGVLGPQPVTLYRTLYIYYKRHHNSVLQQDIFRLLITVVMQHPKYTSHTINFIRAVARFQPKSDLPVNLLSALNDQIMSTPMQSVLVNLSYHIVMLETAALYPQLSPLGILKILNKLLSSSNLLSEGNWSLGNSFLSICHKLMQTHNTSLIFKDLCEVLIQISLHYCDIDIRDRALFYRHLLLTVSGDKLSSILSMTSSDLASGSASLSQIVEARISDTSYPTTPPVQNISETFLNLTRICGSSKDPVYLLESGNHHHQLGTDSLIEDYLTKLNETGSNPPVVQIHYQLQFVDDIPPAVSVPALEQIFAVSLQFSTISPYRPIPDVHVSHLTSKKTDSAAYHNITVSITPKEPVPTKLHVNAVFTSNEGQTCATKLGCLDIRFEDLFQPVPTDLVSDMDVFFKKMWAHIRNNEYSKSSPNQQGAASVIRLKADSVRTKEVYKELSMFTTNKNSNGLNHFLIFLPPKYHLLLQLEHHSEDQSVVVSIATDYWKILPLVNNYFRT